MYSAYTPFQLLNKILNPDEIGSTWNSLNQQEAKAEKFLTKFRAEKFQI